MLSNIEEFLPKLHTNQRLLVEELLRRSVSVKVVVPELELLEVEFAGRKQFLFDRDSSVLPYAACMIVANKYLTKTLLQEKGLAVSKGEQFFADQKQDAVRYITKKLNYPIVVKPVSGSHGEGVWGEIESNEEFEEAFDALIAKLGKETPILVEKALPWPEYRFFVTSEGKYAVLRRDPAAVLGDGVRSIGDLVAAENHHRANPRTNCLCPIVLDATVTRHLAKRNLTTESTPAAGINIQLRPNSNLATGGFATDVTESLHPEFLSIAHAALSVVHGLPYAGIDILILDIQSKPEKSNYAILEINSNPGLHMHMRPGTGASRNVAAYLADIIFPETRGRERRS